MLPKKEELLRFFAFPDVWRDGALYPDALFHSQLHHLQKELGAKEFQKRWRSGAYGPGDEHWRCGALYAVMAANPKDGPVHEKLWHALSRDPDPLMAKHLLAQLNKMRSIRVKKLIAANWKMNKTQAQAQKTASDLMARIPALPDTREVVLFAPYTALSACVAGIGGRKGFAVGGQNMYPADNGAFTGEISPAMLKDCGCTYALLGHSERRALLHESSAFIGEKTAFALQNGLKAMLCVGETLEERERGKLEAVLQDQLEKGLANVKNDVAVDSLSIAYEPVWAIGTGKVAGEAEIKEAHALIRKLLCLRFPAQGSELRILYGGSVKPDNTKQILALDNVDGVLVGGASLDAETLSQIVLL